jgi:hypothetical protein
MIELSAAEKIDARDNRCFFRASSEIPGYGRFFSAVRGFPCSIAVPGKPRFVYSFWDRDHLAVAFDIQEPEDVVISRFDIKAGAERGDWPARQVLQGSWDEVNFVEQREREIALALGDRSFRVRPRSAVVPGFAAHRIIFRGGVQRVFFMDSSYVVWNIGITALDEPTFGRVTASFRLLSDEYFAWLESGGRGTGPGLTGHAR